MIYNMDTYDKIIHITNMNDYKKVCNKLDWMWYQWAWGLKLTSYRNYFRLNWTITLYTYVGKKYVCHWDNTKEAISTDKFLFAYDL